MTLTTCFEYCMALREAFTAINFKKEMGKRRNVIATKSTIHCNFKMSDDINGLWLETYQSSSIFNECLLNKITFEISSFIIDHHSSFNPQEQMLCDLLNDAIADLISEQNEEYGFEQAVIDLIVQFTKAPLAWDRKYHTKMILETFHLKIDYVASLVNSFGYSRGDSMIRWQEEIRDAMNVPSTFEIDLSKYIDCNYTRVVHCCCLNKGEETWLGLIPKSKYTATYLYPQNAKDAVVLYGGLEELNVSTPKQLRIYKKGEQVTCSLDSLKGGDWISVVINSELPSVDFYVNGEKRGSSILIGDIVNEGPLLLYVLVDAEDDTWYIEESLAPNCYGLN